MANKSYNLERGFLILYEWVEMFEALPPEDSKALLMALIDRQRNGTPFPEFSNKLTGIFARVIEPAIQCRLNGQIGGNQNKPAEQQTPPPLPPSPTPLIDPPTPLKLSRDKLSRDKLNISGTTYPPPPTGSGVGVMDERFEAFWKAYPKKVGKEAAKKVFKKIKPSAALLETMLNAIGEQRASDQWRKDNGQFIPNPATWLNQGRWEDEVTETASPQANILDQNNILEVLTK